MGRDGPNRKERAAWYGQQRVAAGGELSFVVFEPTTGNRSSRWAVKTSGPAPAGKPPRDDVYLWETTTGGRFKASHHLGKWQIAMTGEYATAVGEERLVFDRRDPPSAGDGWREGVAVLVPCAYLRPSTAPLKSAVRKIPASPARSAVIVSLALEDEGASVMRQLPAAFPVGVLARSGGGSVWVVAEMISLGAREHETLARFCDQARAAYSPGDRSGRFVGILAVDDRRMLVDLCIA